MSLITECHSPIHPTQKADSHLHTVLDRATLEWPPTVAGPCADTNGLPLPPLLLHVLSGQQAWRRQQGIGSLHRPLESVLPRWRHCSLVSGGVTGGLEYPVFMRLYRAVLMPFGGSVACGVLWTPCLLWGVAGGMLCRNQRPDRPCAAPLSLLC